jgi:hypothetical protein
MSDNSPKADMQVDGPGSPTNFGALQERVRNIDVRLGELTEAVKEATMAMSLLGKPKWQVWIGLGTLVVGASVAMWNLAITPVSDRVRALEMSAMTIVPREVHIEKWAQNKEDFQRVENEILQRATKDDLNRMAFDLLQKIEKKK